MPWVAARRIVRSAIVTSDAATVITSVEVYCPSRMTASRLPLAERSVTPGRSIHR
jgi:hypothetical protein